eukprot:g1606.t1
MYSHIESITAKTNDTANEVREKEEMDIEVVKDFNNGEEEGNNLVDDDVPLDETSLECLEAQREELEALCGILDDDVLSYQSTTVPFSITIKIPLLTPSRGFRLHFGNVENSGTVKVAEKKEKQEIKVVEEKRNSASVVKKKINCNFGNVEKSGTVKVAEKKEKQEIKVVEEKRNSPSVVKKKIHCKYFNSKSGCRFGKKCRFLHQKTFVTTTPRSANSNPVSISSPISTPKVITKKTKASAEEEKVDSQMNEEFEAARQAAEGIHRARRELSDTENTLKLLQEEGVPPAQLLYLVTSVEKKREELQRLENNEILRQQKSRRNTNMLDVAIMRAKAEFDVSKDEIKRIEEEREKERLENLEKIKREEEAEKIRQEKALEMKRKAMEEADLQCRASSLFLQQQATACRIQHLPPLIITFTLPSVYPKLKTVEISQFRAFENWLPDFVLVELQQRLEIFCQENVGNSVIFHLVNFVRESTFDNLATLYSNSTNETKNSSMMEEKGKKSVLVKLVSEQLAAAGGSDWIAASKIADCIADVRKANKLISTEMQKQYNLLLPMEIYINKDVQGMDRKEVKRMLGLIREWNRDQRVEIFSNEKFECPICYADGEGTDFVLLKRCAHIFCFECLKDRSTALLQDGLVVDLNNCPHPECSIPMDQKQVESFFSKDEEREKWRRLSLQKALEKCGDIVYCPRCESPVIEEKNDKNTSPDFAQCAKCFFSFCPLCREPYHPGSQCLNLEEKLRRLQERSGGKISRKQKVDYELEKRKKDLEMEIKSLQSIYASDAKSCPVCRIFIAKTEGCNKMVCSCGTKFCFSCGKIIGGYDHFRDPATKCVLFDDEELDRWNQQIRMMGGPAEQNRRMQRQQQQRQQRNRGNIRMMPQVIGSVCPGCGVYNVKIDDNNDIKCFQCKTRFCGICRLRIKNTSHFKIGRCTQHSK